MANKSTVYLTDKDIRNLEIKPKRYKKAVGEPKELYIWVNPKGSKVFFIKYKDESNKEQSITIQEFREGIYSVKEARNEARYILNQIYNGKTLQEIKNSDKYIFKNLFYRYVDIKKDKVSENYLKKMINRINLHIMPSLANMDVKDIKSTMLRDFLSPLFNRDNPSKSRLETIHRIIRDLKTIFSFALRDGYIAIDPIVKNTKLLD